MKHRLLFGTTNPSKIDIIRAFLETLPVEILTPAELNIDINVFEDGNSTEENAAKKSRAYYAASGLPTLAIDAGLSILDLPPEKQPGVFVRRIFGAGQEVSDQQMLDYYIQELNRVGGKSTARWKVSTAFTIGPQTTIIDSFTFDAALVSQPSSKVNPGVPLSSLMIDPRSGRYLSEIDHRQRMDAEFIQSIMRKNLAQLDAIEGGFAGQNS